jgi:hypothetical protein
MKLNKKEIKEEIKDQLIRTGVIAELKTQIRNELIKLMSD